MPDKVYQGTYDGANGPVNLMYKLTNCPEEYSVEQARMRFLQYHPEMLGKNFRMRIVSEGVPPSATQEELMRRPDVPVFTRVSNSPVAGPQPGEEANRPPVPRGDSLNRPGVLQPTGEFDHLTPVPLPEAKPANE